MLASRQLLTLAKWMQTWADDARAARLKAKHAFKQRKLAAADGPSTSLTTTAAAAGAVSKGSAAATHQKHSKGNGAGGGGGRGNVRAAVSSDSESESDSSSSSGSESADELRGLLKGIDDQTEELLIRELLRNQPRGDKNLKVRTLISSSGNGSSSSRTGAYWESKGGERGVSGGSISGGRGINWSRWKPWFQPDCPFCVREVEELMELERQHKKGAGAAGAAAAAGAGLDPPDYPWRYELYLQQQKGCVSGGGGGPSAATTAASATGGDRPGHHPVLKGGGNRGSKSASPAAAASGVKDPRNLHGSVYGCWPVPWDCPFRYRRLMWRLLGRVKPSALHFWAEREHMCAHATGAQKWRHMVIT